MGNELVVRVGLRY